MDRASLVKKHCCGDGLPKMVRALGPAAFLRSVSAQALRGGLCRELLPRFFVVMKKHLFISVFLLLFSHYSWCSNHDRIAWIEERFANCIIDSGIIHREYLFPIDGFECIQGEMYILTYGGELSRVQSKETDDGYLITNFEHLINLQVWPNWLVEKYGKSQIYYNFENENIILTIKGKHILERYRFINEVRGSRFGSILEIKGWLLDVLIGHSCGESWGF